MRDLDRFRGCLIGGAAGDALGYAVEFKREGDIFSHYGEQGITEYELRHGKALISDDTQMTLFTATGLLNGTTRGKMRGIMADYSDYIRYSYKDWLKTQTRSYPLPKDEFRYSWLVNIPELFDRRAPGNTCMSALESDAEGTVEEPVNSSKGCGGVMRVAPVGLYFNDRQVDCRKVARIGADAAAITHGHILGWMPAAVLAQIIHEISQDDAEVEEAVLHALETAKEMWPGTPQREKLISLLYRAISLAHSDAKDLEAIHQLGEGWVAEETLAVAVYCAIRHKDDFDAALIAAVNHNGDSDSTGAVTGNILGAKIGLTNIPEKYITNLELKDTILEIADDLWHDCQMTEYGKERDPVWISKYVKAEWPESEGRA